jgi:hypothetical protein
MPIRQKSMFPEILLRRKMLRFEAPANIALFIVAAYHRIVAHNV